MSGGALILLFASIALLNAASLLRASRPSEQRLPTAAQLEANRIWWAKMKRLDGWLMKK